MARNRRVEEWDQASGLVEEMCTPLLYRPEDIR